ncbi:MAG: ABC transporter ATP-binding protein [Candidatus Thorarchaeota archaeon]
MESTIELVNLTKYYGKHRGIENLSIKINPGVISGFLGPNGAGKTTTIRCLLGILKPTKGQVRVFGHEITNWGSQITLKERIGYLPGEFDLYKHFTVKGILDYFTSLRNRPAILRNMLINAFELDESRNISQLSKGNKQKVGLIQALMHDPDLLVLDEPSTGLDPLMQQRLYSVLRKFRDRGKTVFFSSHNLAEVQKICDEVTIIKEGFLVSQDHIDDLSHRVQQQVILTMEEPIDSLLDQIPLINHFEKIRTNGKGHRYSIYLESAQLNFSDLFQSLSSQNIQNVVIPEPSLEDYFLQYYKED